MKEVPGARHIVFKTRDTLSRLITQLKAAPGNPSMPGMPAIIPQDVLTLFDKFWRHFGKTALPFQDANHLFPEIKSNVELFTSVDSIYEKIARALDSPDALFCDLPAPWFDPGTKAFTLNTSRSSEDPPPSWPNGIYFKSEYAPLSQHKKAEIIVHELSHWVGNQIDQKIQDGLTPDDPEYPQHPTANQIDNAWSYSQFALDCAFDMQLPFGR